MTSAVMGVVFSEWLRTMRRRVNISQAALADRVGVTRQTVSNWERGTNPGEISLVAAQKLAAALNTDLDNVASAIQGRGRL